MVKSYDFEFLIQSFLSQEISTGEFENIYLDAFKHKKGMVDEEIFELLDWMFAKVDMYTDLPIGPDENPDNYINEEQLRAFAAECLDDLRALKEKTLGQGGAWPW